MADHPSTSLRARVIRGNHGARGFVRSSNEGGASHDTFAALAWAIGDVRRRRHLRRVIANAGAPEAIGRCGEGLVRIEGRVEIVEPVTAPSGEKVAMYVVHDAHEEPCLCQQTCTAHLRVIRATRDAGRFVVRDTTGAALVEHGRLRLRDYKGNVLDPWLGGALFVRRGDMVTVVGEAGRGGAHLPTAATPRGYRDAQPPLVFEGTAESPTYVFTSP